ncbi:unnamed protein product [Arctogadus glacialis]
MNIPGSLSLPPSLSRSIFSPPLFLPPLPHSPPRVLNRRSAVEGVFPSLSVLPLSLPSARLRAESDTVNWLHAVCFHEASSMSVVLTDWFQQHVVIMRTH